MLGITTTLELKLDYDCSKVGVIRKFTHGYNSIVRVYKSKRTYIPILRVQRVVRSRRGYHVYVNVILAEGLHTTTRERWMTLALQSVLGSDSTRGLYDALRVCRNDRVFNLLFSYKNGYLNTEDSDLEQKLNVIVGAR